MNMKNINNLSCGMVLLLVVAVAGACSNKGSSAKPPGGCNLKGSGTAGAATVTPAQPVTLDTMDGNAQNTVALDSAGQITTGARGVLRIGNCGTAGLLLVKPDGSKKKLIYVDPKAGGTMETVDATANSAADDASLFFDAACTAIVLLGSASDGYVEYVRQAGGTWTRTVVQADLSSILGGAPSFLNLLSSMVGKNGKFYIFSKTKVNGTDALVKGERDAAAGSTWTFSKLPMPATTDLFGVWTDPGGKNHTLYRNTNYPCDPCNVDLEA